MPAPLYNAYNDGITMYYHALCDPPTGGPTYCRPLSGCRRPVYYVAIRSSFGPLCLDMARPDPRARRVRVRSAISTPNRIAFEAMKVVEGRGRN